MPDCAWPRDLGARAAGKPWSFLHISKPKTHLYSPAVYAKGKENFERMQREGARDPQPCYYLYRLVMGMRPMPVK